LYEALCKIIVGTSRGSAAGSSTSGTGAVSPVQSPQVERLRSTVDKDKGHSQRKQSTSASKTPAKHQSVGDKSAVFKYKTKTPNKTPSADRYVVFLLGLQKVTSS